MLNRSRNWRRTKSDLNRTNSPAIDCARRKLCSHDAGMKCVSRLYTSDTTSGDVYNNSLVLDDICGKFDVYTVPLLLSSKSPSC